MTWQRIAENTYIDNTLVTCAEYQLFIDEMREQGKYYQPDHWISYKFPKGQAREPILGVRHSDAEAFCKWLTSRETGEWLYRLPTSADAEKCPLINPIQSPLGYWSIELNDKAKFIWVGIIPVNPRNIDINLDLARDRVHTFDHGFNLDRANITARQGLEHEPARDLKLILSRGRNLAFASNKEFDSALDGVRILAYKRKNARTHYNAPTNLARARANLAVFFARAHYRVRAKLIRVFINVFGYTPYRTNARIPTLPYPSIGPDGKDYTWRLDDDYNFALDIYIDIFTLQERIAGRSPAFEGIRLVKERIR